MNKKLPNTLLLILCFVLIFGFAFYSFAVSQAQTPQRERQAATPTPKPTVKPLSDLAPPPPLPVVDDSGPIVIKTELVNLNVRVVDRNNRSIGSLQKDDFKIFENGAAQPIDSFSKGEVPTNYSLVIDNSGSLRFQLDKVIEASKVIVGTNRPDDETSVVRFVSSEKIEIIQDFTPSKTDLNDALDNLYIEGGQTAIIDAIYLTAERVDKYEKSRDPNDRKRRALIVISDGEDRDSFYNEQQLFQMLRESDVQIYVVGFINELEKEGGLISKSPQKKAKSFLERLATETGGKAYFPNNLNELNTIASDIASELRTQYSISYYPTNDEKDGTFRNIKVVVADGPNNQKRIAVTRNGRIAGKEGNAPPNLQNTQKVKSQ
jgi:Ca-activated chloride channel family protein